MKFEENEFAVLDKNTIHGCWVKIIKGIIVDCQEFYFIKRSYLPIEFKKSTVVSVDRLSKDE